MASATQAANTDQTADDQPDEIRPGVAAKVSLTTFQKLNYLAIKRTLATGTKVTMSKTVGELLDKIAEDLPEPPADLLQE